MKSKSLEHTIWGVVLANDALQLRKLLQNKDEATLVQERNDLGETALHLAASKGFNEVVQVLLEHGADIMAQDWESGWTPLHRSMYYGHVTTSLLLLRRGRQVVGRTFFTKLLYETKDFNGESALDLVSSSTINESTAKEASGCVYTFGKVDFQLGYHLPHATVQSTPRMVELPVTSRIVQISANKYHTLAVNANGQCFAWGFGKGGRLGTGTEFDHVEPTLLQAFDGIHITKVAAGENHSLAISSNGHVFAWGANSFGQLGQQLKNCTSQSRLLPKRVDAFRNMVVTAIAASSCHSAAIVANGEVFTWGSNRKGQLGRKDGFGTDQPHATPKRVDALVPEHPLSAIYESYTDVQAVQVALSEVHSSVILRCTRNGRSHGQVWQFGYGFHFPSRVNFKDKKRASSVILTEAWIPTWKHPQVNIVKISCASQHSMALSADGTVYTWGHNNAALSHASTSGTTSKDTSGSLGSPQPVTALAGYGPIRSICAAQDHCAVVTEAGDLVTWGGGTQGVLGHGMENTWQPSPKRVKGAKKVVEVVAGHQHTAILVAPRVPAIHTLGDELAIPTLQDLLQDQIASYIDITNAATVFKYAEAWAMQTLRAFCRAYLQLNWDAVLEFTGKERIDGLFDLFLEDFEPIQQIKHQKTTTSPSVPPVPTKKKVDKPRKVCDSPSRAETAAPPVEPEKPQVISKQCEDHPSKSKSSKRRNAKFVSLNEFFAAKPPASASNDVNCPWSATIQQAPPLNPRLQKILASEPKKNVASPVLRAAAATPPAPVVPRKAVLCGDGVERPPTTTFALDCFIKASSRKGKKRSDSIEKPAPTWSEASTRPATMSLKEIQAEEAAKVAAEAAAKARVGGFARPKSTFNSWGLCETPDHISLVDIQKLQEDQGPLDLRIMAQDEKTKDKHKAPQQQEEKQSKARRTRETSERRMSKAPKPQADQDGPKKKTKKPRDANERKKPIGKKQETTAPCDATEASSDKKKTKKPKKTTRARPIPPPAVAQPPIQAA